MSFPIIAALVSEACDQLGNMGELIGGRGAPRFTLFHAPNSICSHKVRAVLAHHDIGYTSCSMNIAAGDTYVPAHVRLRLLACEREGLPLVDGHDGSTSLSSRGCDPAVVPTLVDWHVGQVIVDSKKICLHLDALMPEAASLYPAALQARIDTELDCIDNLPNYQMMIGGLARAEREVEGVVGQKGVDFSLAKVRRCDDYIAQYATDIDLARAYGAKRAKELQAAQKLFSTDAMLRAHEIAQQECERLEHLLEESGTAWLFGDFVTIADLFWAIQLIRLRNVGMSGIWEGGKLPYVEDFVLAVTALKPIRNAIIEWPGAL